MHGNMNFLNALMHYPIGMKSAQNFQLMMVLIVLFGLISAQFANILNDKKVSQKVIFIISFVKVLLLLVQLFW